MRWLEPAWAELGELEVTGRDANPAILGYFRAVGRSDITSDETAWCGGFVGACLLKGGVRLDGIAPADRLLANSYLRIGTPINELRVGAIVVLSRGSNPAFGHVGFCVGFTADTIALLGGNQANSVSVAHFPRARIRGIRWPEVATPRDVAAESRIAGAARQQQKDGGKVIGTEVMPAPPQIDIPPPDALAAKAGAFQGVVEQGLGFWNFLGAKWPYALGAFALYWIARIVWHGWQIHGWRISDALTGKTVTAVARPAIEPDFFGASDSRSASRPDAQEAA